MQGKTDKHPVTLQLWRDKLNPELCPIVNLQLYSYLIGIKGILLCLMPGGHLFPTLHEIESKPSDGIYRSCLSGQSYRDKFQDKCNTLFKRKGKWGTHTCRKTAYLLAVWGGGTFQTIMRSARHSVTMLLILGY